MLKANLHCECFLLVNFVIINYFFLVNCSFTWKKDSIWQKFFIFSELAIHLVIQYSVNGMAAEKCKQIIKRIPHICWFYVASKIATMFTKSRWTEDLRICFQKIYNTWRETWPAQGKQWDSLLKHFGIKRH